MASFFRMRRPFVQTSKVAWVALCGAVLLATACSKYARKEQALRKQAIAIGAPASVVDFPKVLEMPGRGPFMESDWFRLVWLDQRVRFWMRRAEDHGGIVFAGDSITQGWEQLGSEFPDLKVVNRGIAGDTSRGVLFRFREDVLSLNPQAVVLLVGINDLSGQAAPEIVAQNVKNILDMCWQEHPSLPVILCKVMPVGAEKPDVNGRVRALNLLLEAMSAAESRVTLCDTWKIFANANFAADKADFKDLLHPNDQGYAKLANALRQVLRDVLALHGNRGQDTWKQ